MIGGDLIWSAEKDAHVLGIHTSKENFMKIVRNLFWVIICGAIGYIISINRNSVQKQQFMSS